MLRGMIMIFILVATNGCTTIHIATLNGEPPRIERRLGLVSIRMPDSADDAVVLATHGFGAARTPTGFTLGFWKERLALFRDPSTCRTVIWVEDQRVFDEIRRSLSNIGQSLHSLCIINGDKL